MGGLPSPRKEKRRRGLGVGVRRGVREGLAGEEEGEPVMRM